MSGSAYHHRPDPYHGWVEEVGGVTWATGEELAAVSARCGQPFRAALHYKSVGVDSPKYMAWLRSAVVAGGGRLASARIATLSDLAPHFHLVVNASGHGARELAADPCCHAYRGQVIRVYAPHVTSFATATTTGAETYSINTYVLPRPTSGVVTCGGTYERDQEALGVGADTADAIWARCTALVPALADARTRRLHDWVGLRPGRDGDVRLQAEQLGELTVLHAYGHGGCGHSLHHGTALDVLELALQAAAGRPDDGWPPRRRFEAPEPAQASAAA